MPVVELGEVVKWSWKNTCKKQQEAAERQRIHHLNNFYNKNKTKTQQKITSVLLSNTEQAFKREGF